MLAWKIAPALAAGNTVVLKPAEFTPAHRAGLAESAGIGLPAGVVNIVTRRWNNGRSPSQASRRQQNRLHRVNRSRPRHPWRDGSSHKRLSLELGGKSPFIVFEDADLDSAVKASSTASGSIKAKSVALDRAS